MNALVTVDQTRKATISLGGRCRLRCTHCYITVSQFTPQRRLSVTAVLDALETCRGQFDAICISGDVDPLLREEDFLDLLEGASTRFRDAHLMFTTRLVPSARGFDRIANVGADLAKRARLLAPGISLMTATYPNDFENPRAVPSTLQRVAFAARLRAAGAPVLAALRPTMPFAQVSKTEVDTLIDLIAPASACILGEVFILDARDELSARFNLPSVADDPKEAMTFLDQPGLWAKRRFGEEIAHAAARSMERGRSYFLRSMSAMRYLEKWWDFNTLDLRDHSLLCSGIYDDQNP